MARKQVDALLAELGHPPAEKVLVLSKSYCPWCKKLKARLDDQGIAATFVQMDKIPKGDELHAKVKDITQHRTVPNVFWGVDHIGGYDDTDVVLKDIALVTGSKL